MPADDFALLPEGRRRLVMTLLNYLPPMPPVAATSVGGGEQVPQVWGRDNVPGQTPQLGSWARDNVPGSTPAVGGWGQLPKDLIGRVR